MVTAELAGDGLAESKRRLHQQGEKRKFHGVIDFKQWKTILIGVWFDVAYGFIFIGGTTSFGTVQKNSVDFTLKHECFDEHPRNLRQHGATIGSFVSRLDFPRRYPSD